MTMKVFRTENFLILMTGLVIIALAAMLRVGPAAREGITVEGLNDSLGGIEDRLQALERRMLAEEQAMMSIRSGGRSSLPVSHTGLGIETDSPRPAY